MGPGDQIDDIIEMIDALLGPPEDPLPCWFCKERAANPSMCDPCRKYLMTGGGRPDNVSPP